MLMRLVCIKHIDVTTYTRGVKHKACGLDTAHVYVGEIEEKKFYV